MVSVIHSKHITIHAAHSSIFLLMQSSYYLCEVDTDI